MPHFVSAALSTNLTSRCLPLPQVWLDVDDGNRSMKETSKDKRPPPQTLEEKYQRAVEIVDTVLVFLAGIFLPDGTPVSTYFQSMYCRHEFMAAIRYEKRIVVILETEPSKGGIPLHAHLDEAAKHPEMDAIVALLNKHSEQGWIVPWHRIRVFQDLSLRLALAPIVCRDSSRVEEITVRQGAEVYLPSEIIRRPLGRLPVGCHLYVSEFNPGAIEVARLVASGLRNSKGRPKGGGANNGGRGAIRWTNNPETMAGRFLLVLNASTWDRSANPYVDQLFQYVIPAAHRTADLF